MPSVGGVGGQGSLLVQQLGRLATSRTSTDEARKAQIETAAKKAGVDLGAIEGLRDKVQSAVETALKENQGKSQSEIMLAVQAAIDQTLTDSGVDPEELQSQLTALQSQMPQERQGMRGGPPPGGPPPGGPPPGGPPPGAGSATDSTSTTTGAETTTAIQTLLDSGLSLEEILRQLMEAAEERAAQSSNEGTTETSAASGTASAIQQLLSSDASFEDILQQLVSMRDQQADEQSRIERLANMITTSLFGPALDTYA